MALILMIVILIVSFVVLGITQSNYHQCLDYIEEYGGSCYENLAAPLVPMVIGIVGILCVIVWNPTHFNLSMCGTGSS